MSSNLERSASPGIRRLTSVREVGPLLGLIALCALVSILSPVFLTTSNLMNVLVQAAVASILAAGVNFAILTGGIDLSVGSLLGLIGVLIAAVFKSTGSVFLAVATGLVLGFALGLLNGSMVTVGRIPSFIATLGTMSIARGLAFVFTQGRPISSFPDSFRALGAGELGGIPIPVIVVLVVYAAAHYVLTQTPFGRAIYAIGSNEEAARLSGVNVGWYKTAAFGVSGLLAGLAAIMFTGRINSAHPLAGQGYELDAIAAVVIGGTSLSGGEGRILGTLIGALIMGVIRNGLNLLMVDSYWQQVIIGAVIVVAVLIDRRGRAAEGAAVVK
ncbi:MAG: ribose ABC transporter permease [Firmicutes bacterium]|nr:ribose ABC transporter permease [Bacillota bacterium]MBO2521080.1 ribose ABC transporter permease [Bacillota bacterium]